MANKMVFVNIPVKDLARSKAFFEALGYSFNPQFTDEKAGCLIINDGAHYVMLVTEPFFKTFIPDHEIADATKTKEAIICFSCDSREEVDQLIEKAMAQGATPAGATEDYGWMYSRSFMDLDGHAWNFVYMDMANVPANPGATVDHNATA